MTIEELDDEVLFWQGMIDRWEASVCEPVPDRMHEALSLARRNARLFEALSLFTGRTIH